MSEVNTDLVRLIVAQIEDTPEHWSQKDWVKHNCNTTFCFAGWAVFMSDLVDGSGKPTAAGKKKARQVLGSRHDVPYVIHVDENGNEKWYYPYFDVAQDLLGLDENQASRLFSAYSAQPRGSHGDVPEDINLFKQRITDLTGVRFP